MTQEKLLEDLKNSKEGSIEEKVCMDIFMNMYAQENINTINFIRAFHGPIIRDDIIMILDKSVLDMKKAEITKSLKITFPGYFKKILDVLKSHKK